MMLENFPMELALEAFKYLTVQDLAKLKQLSVYWKTFLSVNESSIYHNAAVLHGLVSSLKVSLSHAIAAYPARSMVSVGDWKEFCKRRFQIEASWAGRGPSTTEKYSASGDVHWFAIAEEEECIIVTNERGLFVLDISQGHVLWSLSKGYVMPRARCEYNGGFLVFNRDNGFIEVWRKACGFDDIDSFCDPDQRQSQASAEASRLHASSSLRGHFRPWVLLRSPSMQVFCFVHHTVLAASRTQAFLWDILTAQPLQKITFPENFGQVNHVQLSSMFIFICFHLRFVVFSRESGLVSYFLDLSLSGYTRWNIDLCHTDFREPTDMHDTVLSPRITLDHDENGPEDGDNQPVNLENRLMWWSLFKGAFKAAEISGTDLVILLDDSRILVIRNYESVINGHVGLSDAALEITFFKSCPGISEDRCNIAFQNGKLALRTYAGIFVIALDGLENTTSACGSIQLRTHPLFPNISICWASRLNAIRPLVSLSCLRLSDTGIFFPWDLTFPPGPLIPSIREVSQEPPSPRQTLTFVGARWTTGHDLSPTTQPTSLNEDDLGSDDLDISGENLGVGPTMQPPTPVFSKRLLQASSDSSAETINPGHDVPTPLNEDPDDTSYGLPELQVLDSDSDSDDIESPYQWPVKGLVRIDLMPPVN